MATRKQLEDCRADLDGLEKMVKLLDYKEPYNGNQGDLCAFFADNPGAVEAVMEWVADRQWEQIDDIEYCDDCEESVDDCLCDEPGNDDDSED